MTFRTRQHTHKFRRLRDINPFEQSGGVIRASIPQDILGIPDEKLSELYQSAAAFIDQDDLPNAVRAFTLLCHLHPYIPDFWSGLGLSLRGLRIFEEALSAFLMAETLDSHRFDFYEQAIVCAMEMENWKEAQHIFARLMAHRKKIENFSLYKSKISEIKRALIKKNTPQNIETS